MFAAFNMPLLYFRYAVSRFRAYFAMFRFRLRRAAVSAAIFFATCFARYAAADYFALC